MNDYEMTLVAALRAEAEEIAMTIDHKQASDELESRMDDADRARRGTYWAAAAAAVVVIGGAALLSGNWTGDSAESLPGGNNTTDHAATGITYTSNLTAMPFTVTLPPWLLENDVRQAEVHSHAIYWDSEWCATSREVNCTTGGLGLRIAIPRAIYRPGTEGPQPVPDFQGYLSFLNSLETTSSLRITDRTSANVDGLPAEVMTLTPIYQAVDARFSCDKVEATLDDCWFPTAGRQLRLAAVDTGGTPMVIWMVGRSDDRTDWAAVYQDFDTMLGTIKLGDLPAPSAS